MTQTTHLALPFIEAAQAQKHVTHNEALQLLDALVQLSVGARNQGAPPVSPSEGQRFLVGAGATGVFAGKDLQIATFLAGAWTFLVPQVGWRVYVEAEQVLLVYDGAAWGDAGLALRALQNLSLLGIGTSASAGNPLSAKLNAALLTAKSVGEGGSGDLRVTLNKSASGNIVSQLYQTNFSGRAETGLMGDDYFHVKVSADGSTWHEAINVDPATGEAAFLQRRLQMASAAHGGKTEMFCAEELISLSGANMSSTVVIPDGAIVLAVSNRVVTAVTGSTSYSCGVAGNTTQFGSLLGIGLGAANRGLIAPAPFYADTPVLYTAAGGNFTGGQVRMTIHYLLPTWAAN